MPNYPWETEKYKQYPQRGISSNGMDIVENPDKNPILIGHTFAYFDELIAAGQREKPKTAEELIQEQSIQQQEINAKLLEAISGLQNEIKGLKNFKLESEKVEPKSDIGNRKGVLSKANPKAAQALNNPQLINQATQAYNSFSHDKEGALKAIGAFGGMKMLDRAIETVKKYPIVDFALRGVGIDVGNVKKDLSSGATHPQIQQQNSVLWQIIPSIMTSWVVGLMG